MYEWSNFLAVAWVIFTAAVGVRYILPAIPGKSGKIHYVHLLAWGLPFVAGQVAQNTRLGSQWLQNQLCDLGYAVWASTLGISVFALLHRLRGRDADEANIRRWSIRSFWGFTILGHVMEVWDTLWAWSYSGSLTAAIDRDDYIALTGGALFAIICYGQLGQPRFMRARFTISRN